MSRGVPGGWADVLSVNITLLLAGQNNGALTLRKQTCYFLMVSHSAPDRRLYKTTNFTGGTKKSTAMMLMEEFMTDKKRFFQTPVIFSRKQSGIALFVCLLFTLMITMVAVVSIQGETLNERIAGNARDKTLAFQAAEAALRSAESYLSGTPGAFTAAGTNGRYLVTEASVPSALISAAQAATWSKNAWNANLTSVACSGSCSNIALMVANAPKYIMEQLPANALNETSLVLGKPNKKTSAVYRITAAGTGTSDNSYVVLQSIYRKPG